MTAQGPARGPLRIILGVTGGIAAYKAPMIARLLTKAGHDVRVIPTENALRMVGAPTFAAVTSHPVTTGVFDDPASIDHVECGRRADLVIVAPATANTLAKMAAGIADDLLTNTLLVAQCPIVVAPAMHTQMWNHSATQDNIATLRRRGVTVIEPASGPLTSGDSGPGRLPEPDDIVAQALELVSPGDLDGQRFVISAGGTREPIDPVRFIGNRSSGRQGIALAQSAARRGARVDLVACNIDQSLLPSDPLITIHPAESTADLASAIDLLVPGSDVVIMAAAVADYSVTHRSESKMKKNGAPPVIELQENPDILAGLARDRSHRAFVVGFAAETGDSTTSFLEYGRQKAIRKQADLLVVNEVGDGQGFGDVDNRVEILDKEGNSLGRGEDDKSRIADLIVQTIVSVR